MFADDAGHVELERQGLVVQAFDRFFWEYVINEPFHVFALVEGEGGRLAKRDKLVNGYLPRADASFLCHSFVFLILKQRKQINGNW